MQQIYQSANTELLDKSNKETSLTFNIFALKNIVNREKAQSDH